jgi:hypothetical protein
MAIDSDSTQVAKWSPRVVAAAVLLMLIFSAVAIGTLRGCIFVDPQNAAQRAEERKKQAEKKKKDDFEIAPLTVQPAEPESNLQFAKPGHWATANQKARANYRDFVGDLTVAVVDSERQPYPVAKSPFVLTARRPVLLTRGRPKAIESTFFVPDTNQAMRLATQLEERGFGLRVAPAAARLNVMPSYQYHFVVLAKEPSRYGYVKTLDSVNVPFGGESEVDDIEDSPHYRVVLLPLDQTIAIPDNPLTWTSIAYILWDEVDPQLFTAEQQRALVDWLHWGGQLIVSGPGSLDLLQGSFLNAYLPADNGGRRTIAAGDSSLAELSDAWTISTAETPGEPLRSTASWPTIELQLKAGGQVITDTGRLFAERQLGQGRIVVSAMQLSQRDLINWRGGFESFFNAVLLRRPPREYRPGYFGEATLAWADAELKDRRLDARLTTKTRYFARDSGVDTAFHYDELPQDMAQPTRPAGQPTQTYRPPAAAGGIGAWNDFSAAANAARVALREAAGVEVPGAGFIVLCLASYLVVLVPINWLIFHALGRIEWAWAAAPVIAIVGTLVIVERARLDIGFVRAHTEIGLLELQPGYSRAHLSRYTALYASLSSTYDLEYENLTALAAPFPTAADPRLLRGQGLAEVGFQRYDKVRLVGLPISSNSTGMVHSEQMVTLEGAIRLDKSAARGSRRIENHTQFELHSVCLVRRPTRDEALAGRHEFEGRWVGELMPGQSVSVPNRMSRFAAAQPAFAEDRMAEAKQRGAEPLNLEPMFRLALDPQHMQEGELRLVARVDQVLPGQTITPSASQVRGATLVVAHLEYAPLRSPRPDINTRQHITTDTADAAQDVFELN